MRNRRLNASQDKTTSSNLADLGWVATRTRCCAAGNSFGWLDVAGREATVNACGVAVARLQGHSRAPHPSNGSEANVGTDPGVPSPASIMLGGGKACRRLMPSDRGGGLVVVAGVTSRHGERESRLQGEGVQRVRRSDAGCGGRW